MCLQISKLFSSLVIKVIELIVLGLIVIKISTVGKVIYYKICLT